MNRYPLFLDLAGRRVLVVGAGAVATRRLHSLLDAGADVDVVAPTATEEVRALHERGDLRWQPRRVQTTDVVAAVLVLACTDDPSVNASVAREAAERGIWCVRADDARRSAAWVPASAAVDDIAIAVTAGGDPRRARSLLTGTVGALRSGELHRRPGRRRGGEVTLVGGGPGDADLITLRGHRALLNADVVITDRLGPTGLLRELPDEVEVVDVGKTPSGPATRQEDINALLVERATAGQRVVRLKGGDPYVLGRGAEEVEACVTAGVPVHVVPGVSSVTAAPGLAGIPLTHRGLTQHFVVASGHVPPGDPRSGVDWQALAAGGGTLVLLMAVHHRAAIAAELISGGLKPETPAAVVQDASTAHQRISVTTLEALGDTEARPPAVIVVGDVVSLARAVP